MAGVISEGYLSRPFTLARQGDRELVFDVSGTDDETEVQALLVAAAPGAYLGLQLESLHADPLGGGVWKGVARYVRANEDEFTFDTSGGTAKLTQSLSTVNAYAPAGLTPPDFQGAIGVSEDKVEGTDVTIPQFTFSVTMRLAAGVVTTGYKTTLFNMTGTVNNGAFKGLAAGECLFLGASGSQRGDELWSITYRFAGSPNVTGLAVGPITGVTKDGWDYLWVRYGDFSDMTGVSIVKRPVAAYVERVYARTDFSTLGIGI